MKYACDSQAVRQLPVGGTRRSGRDPCSKSDRKCKATFIRDLDCHSRPSITTCAIKQFPRWLVKDRRTVVYALQHLAGGNVATDRRLERRELTDGELRCGSYGQAIAWSDRLATVHIVCDSLRRRSFDLSDEAATVRIEAASEKALRGDTLPLPLDLTAILRPWSEMLGGDEPWWPSKRAGQIRASEFLQVYLANARKVLLEPRQHLAASLQDDWRLSF